MRSLRRLSWHSSVRTWPNVSINTSLVYCFCRHSPNHSKRSVVEYRQLFIEQTSETGFFILPKRIVMFQFSLMLPQKRIYTSTKIAHTHIHFPPSCSQWPASRETHWLCICSSVQERCWAATSELSYLKLRRYSQYPQLTQVHSWTNVHIHTVYYNLYWPFQSLLCEPGGLHIVAIGQVLVKSWELLKEGMYIADNIRTLYKTLNHVG